MSAAAGRVAVLAAATAVSLLAAEALVRGFDLGPEIAPVFRENYRLSADPRLRYELVPGSPDGASRINARGLRGEDASLAKPPGVVRIAVVGDSIAYGLHVSRGRELPSQLERLLNRHLAGDGTRYQVLNFGVSGYGIAEVARSLEVRARPYAPDVVVYAYCLNDPQRYSLEFENLLARTTGAERGYLRLLRRGDRWLFGSRVYALARYGLQSLTREGRAYGEPHLWHRDDPQSRAMEEGTYPAYFALLYRDAPNRARLEAGLAELARVAREGGGVPLLVAIFPLLVHLDAYALTPLHVELRAALDAAGLAWLDLLEPLRAEAASGGEDALRVDPLHPSAAGHRLAALAVLQRLLADGRIPGRGPEDFERIASGLRRPPRALAAPPGPQP